MICNVLDPRNKTLPLININNKQFIKAERLYIPLKKNKIFYFWDTFILFALIFISFVTGFVFWSRFKIKLIKQQKKSLDLMLKENQRRYTDMPQKK